MHREGFHRAGVTLLAASMLLQFIAGCSSEESEAPAVEPIGADDAGRLIVDDRQMADESAGDNWLAFGRTCSEQRFGPLRPANASNVADLKVDWYLDLPDDRGLASTPLVDIVRNGARKDKGMPQFSDFGDEYILAVQHYIRMRAERDLED